MFKLSTIKLPLVTGGSTLSLLILPVFADTLLELISSYTSDYYFKMNQDITMFITKLHSLLDADAVYKVVLCSHTDLRRGAQVACR